MNKIIVLLTTLFILPFPAISHAASVHPYQKAIPPEVSRWASIVAKYFPASEVDKALACMASESGGRPWAYNINKDRTIDQGLFQLNSRYHPGFEGFNPFLPEINIQRASIVWKTHGWKRWYGKACGKPVFFASHAIVTQSSRDYTQLAVKTEKSAVTKEASLLPLGSPYTYPLAALSALLLLRRYIWGRYLLAVGKAVLRASWRALGWFLAEAWRLWVMEVREIRAMGRARRLARRAAHRSYRRALG